MVGVIVAALAFAFFSTEAFGHWYFIRHCAGGVYSRQYCETIWQISVEEPEAPTPCPRSNPVIVNGDIVGCTASISNFRGRHL